MKKTIIDVRSAEEFAGEHAAGTINIPLHEIADRLEELRQFEAPLYLCCASGGRSSIATQFLTGHGIRCKNAGSWRDVLNQTEI